MGIGSINTVSLLECMFCFTADLLCGKAVNSNMGSLVGEELLFVIVLFTRWSAALLPLTPL